MLNVIEFHGCQWEIKDLGNSEPLNSDGDAAGRAMCGSTSIVLMALLLQPVIIMLDTQLEACNLVSFEKSLRETAAQQESICFSFC